MSALSAIARHGFTRRAFALAAVAILALSTAGCFDREPEQRRAFIAFLQTRVIDRPGLRIPILSDKEVADLGPYADQFRIMSKFHHRLDAVLAGDFQRVMMIGNPRSLEALVGQRAIVPVMKTAMAKLGAALDGAEAEADAARKALSQPADLKVVYDKAYEHLVGKPARVLRQLLPNIQAMLDPIQALADYLDAHRDTVRVHGNVISTANARVRREVSALLQAAAKASRTATESKRQLAALATGR